MFLKLLLVGFLFVVICDESAAAILRKERTPPSLFKQSKRSESTKLNGETQTQEEKNATEHLPTIDNGINGTSPLKSTGLREKGGNVKALRDDNDITTLNKTKSMETKVTTNNTQSAGKEKTKSKDPGKKKTAKIVDEKLKEIDEETSGSGAMITGNFMNNKNSSSTNNKQSLSNHTKAKQKEKKNEKTENETTGEWEAEYEPEGSDYTYGDESYGAEGEGYEYTNNNGQQMSKGYNYGLSSFNNPPIIEGQSYESQSNQQDLSDPSQDTSYMHPAMSPQSQGMFDQYSNMLDTSSQTQSPNERTSPVLDDANMGTEYGAYEKKFRTNNTVVSSTGRKRGKLHHKKIHQIKQHRSLVKKARKMVTSQPHYVDGKTYKRTIMIGNRVCGSKKSTNIHSVTRRDEIRMSPRAEETSIKKEQPSAIRATDQCCAEHYDCPRIVPAKSAKYGYQNDIEYDVMGCNCDAKFRNCLKNANSYTADAVGHLYFNTLKIPCLTFEENIPDAKSDLAGKSQESMNVVSVVPDAETERESVGGAQLVVAPRNVQKDAMIEHEKPNMKFLKKDVGDDSQQEYQSNQQLVTISNSRVTKELVKDDDNDDEPVDTKKNKRPDTINPNPSPSNPNPYGIKVRGVVNIPETYLPKISANH